MSSILSGFDSIGNRRRVYLAEIEGVLRHAIGIAPPSNALEEVTLEVVQKLVTDGLFEVGDLPRGDQKTFHAWAMSIENTMDEIRRRWSALDRPIYTDDVCWLSLTEKGEIEAKRIIESAEAPPGILEE